MMRPALYSRRAGGTSTGRLIHKPANLGKMAVYTDVPDDELRAFVADYALGEPVSCKGIAEGVENSNYLLRTERGTYILTLYEK
jgi:homoserine kinase type II